MDNSAAFYPYSILELLMVAPFALGLVLSSIAAVLAWRFLALTRDGAVAAILIGTLIFGFGGLRWAALLVMFFATSSLLTRLQAHRKFHPEHRGGRSADQVLANGAVATAMAVWYGFNPSASALSAFVGAVAAATADTWATEIGLLSPRPPRLITTWKVVPAGQSGAITLLGSAGGAAGAVLIAAAGSWWMHVQFGPIAIAGIAAMFIDSLAGATIEGRIRVIDNNVVNVITTATGAFLAALLVR